MSKKFTTEEVVALLESLNITRTQAQDAGDKQVTLSLDLSKELTTEAEELEGEARMKREEAVLRAAYAKRLASALAKLEG